MSEIRAYGIVAGVCHVVFLLSNGVFPRGAFSPRKDEMA